MKDIFSALNSPYYIYAPAYREDSGGTRAMHYLCHALNLAGEEAYVISDGISDKLRTPRLMDSDRHRHNNENREPIVVYPEIVTANPLNALNVVRYLLNIPGFLFNKPVEWQETDLVYTHGPDIVPAGMSAQILQIPLINTNIYNSEGTTPSKRKGKLLWINRFLSRGGQLLPITEGATEISYRVAHRTAVELRELYRNAELLYTYEQSTACYEAMLCGCPVVYIPNDLMLHQPPIGYLGRSGWAWGTSPQEIQKAKESVPEVLASYKATQVLFWKQLDAFIENTQNHARQNYAINSVVSSNRPLDQPSTKANSGGIDTAGHRLAFYDAYQRWLKNRSFIAGDTAILNKAIAEQNQPPQIHLFLRLQPGDETLLADTLDSLIQQCYGAWHLDIVTPLPSPEGLDELPCIGWHILGLSDDAKAAIDFLAGARKLDWLLELPPGARLDPLFLWRLAAEACTAPEIGALFVDDDCCDTAGQRHSPRFKPGCNPAALQSADLAGPICVRRSVWLAAGGASQHHGSPWFAQLLRIAGQFGWTAIKHVPDVLISYSGSFPSDPESCLFGLLDSFRSKDMDAEVVPTGGRSWGIRYPLGTPPKATIAIISDGQLDLLTRCLTSILGKTRYPEFEILIALGATDDDRDLETWLSDIQQQPSPTIKVTRSADNYAAKCNGAVNRAANEFVVLIREEAVIIQANWLEELIRSCLQPDIVGTAPRLIFPGSALIQHAGNVLGLQGIVGSPYNGEAKLGDPGYLDCLLVACDVSTLPSACMMVRKTAYQAVEGMDEACLGDHFAEIDLCLKLRHKSQRLLFQPLATVVYDGSAELMIAGDAEQQSRLMLDKSRATHTLMGRWGANATVDPYWNQNLSLLSNTPIPEADYRAQWQYLPTSAPCFLARPLPNGQGTFRINSPLRALRKAGQASECVWPQQGQHEPTAPEVMRLKPDTLIVQHYLSDSKLALLESLHAMPGRPFVVFAIDDLLTNMAASNPLRKYVPANSRARLRYALERCDRMVASTNFLAEAYRHFIPDIKVVPNRLEQDIWLPLESRKRTGKKPRIGWAGGTSHLGDLALLKSVIEKTRHEADWIFFGMCPEEIRPLLSEYHAFGELAAYPARLAALSLDIAVAPLEQIPFNQGKSNLRLLEYGILGIPVVCTDIDPYQGSPACCVANTTEAWVAALRERIHDAEAREREGAAIRRWVQQNYLLERHLDDWLNAHLPE